MFYDKEKNKIDMVTALKLMSSDEYCIVKQTKLDNGLFISTVWLGLNHSWVEDGIILFETMVFQGREELATFRYESLQEAYEGHDRAVENWYNYQTLK